MCQNIRKSKGDNSRERERESERKEKKPKKYCVPSADSLIRHQLLAHFLCSKPFALRCLCDERSIIDVEIVHLPFSAFIIQSIHFDFVSFKLDSVRLGSTSCKTCFRCIAGCCYFDNPVSWVSHINNKIFCSRVYLNMSRTSVRKLHCMLAATFLHHEASYFTRMKNKSQESQQQQPRQPA